MKRIIICTLFVAICGIASAQKKGEMSIGGIVGVNTSLTSSTEKSGSVSTTEKTPGTTSFQIVPEFSYFVANNCRLTVGIGYGLKSTPLTKDSDKWLKNNLHLFQIGAGFSYFIKITDKFHYAPMLSFSGLFGKDKINISSSTDYSLGAAGFSTKFSPAMFQFRPLRHIAIDLSLIALDYTRIALTDKEDKENKYINGELGFDIALQPQIGLHYYF